jgi:hypothetical protein
MKRPLSPSTWPISALQSMRVLADRSFPIKFLLDFAHELHRPGVRMKNSPIFSMIVRRPWSNCAEEEAFPQFVKNRNFARSLRSREAPTPRRRSMPCKHFRFRHFLYQLASAWHLLPGLGPVFADVHSVY